jgi:hypothetical protein
MGGFKSLSADKAHMEEGGYVSAPVRTQPDMASALFALELASGMLDSARERFARQDYNGAFEESRNAVRMASSAILFRDGYVSDNLESTVSYLLQRYPGAFPVEGWQGLEDIPLEDTPGLFNMVLSAVGRLKKAGEQEASEALALAAAFVESAWAEMMP